ncbi:hypothetical protein ACFLSS_02365 [Bacteroidota bacterium]
MKTKSNIIFSLLATIALFMAITGDGIIGISKTASFKNASILSLNSPSDTLDMTISDYKVEISRLKEEIKSLKKNKFRVHFDSEKFHEEMKGLANELDKIKTEDFHFKVHFDSKEFKEDIKKLSEELKDQKLVWKNFDFDMEEFNEDMKELGEALKDKHFDFEFDSKSFKKDLEGICENLEHHKIMLENFNFDMGDLEIDMEDLKGELKKLNSFMDDLKSELKNDALIDDVDEDVDLILNKDEMKVDGKKVSDELHQKYLDLYEEHFDKSIEDGFSINSH